MFYAMEKEAMIIELTDAFISYRHSQLETENAYNKGTITVSENANNAHDNFERLKNLVIDIVWNYLA